ncbi:MAG: hypothetical protein ACJ77E_21310 [Gaiellaceae bacterium]
MEAGVEHARIIDEARRRVARGETLDEAAVEAQIRGVHGESQEAALRQLARLVSVQRARSLVARSPAPQPAPTAPPATKPLFRTRPAITGNMDVRRGANPGAFVLEWRREPKVASWEVRFSERPDARGEYVVHQELTLPGQATSLELPLGERLFRVHLLGRDRGGRLVSRAIVSGLTRETWADRWDRRASAS